MGRSTLTVGIGSHCEEVYYNNPTAMALGALLIIRTQGGLAIDISPEAGAVPALVRLLKESTCPQTLVLTAMIMEVLMTMDTTPGRLADCFFECGEWRPMAIYRRKFGSMVRMSRVPCQCYECLSSGSCSAKRLSAIGHAFGT